jgi:hypothetical protein
VGCGVAEGEAPNGVTVGSSGSPEGPAFGPQAVNTTARQTNSASFHRLDLCREKFCDVFKLSRMAYQLLKNMSTDAQWHPRLDRMLEYPGEKQRL